VAVIADECCIELAIKQSEGLLRIVFFFFAFFPRAAVRLK
jgi:hypothetical protein